VKKFDRYALAYLRLAEARSELDDAFGANNAVANASSLMPFGVSLTREEKLRIVAIRSAVLRRHDDAIEAYRDLARLNERDASAWLDLGRALEAAGRRVEALENYQKAVSLDSQYAAAHLRLAIVQVQTGNAPDGMLHFDEALRLYNAAGQREGEVEVLLREGSLLVASGENVKAREAIEHAFRLIDDSQTYYRVRAKFDDARITAFEGNYSRAEEISRKTVSEAVDAGLYSVASAGLTDFSYTLTIQRRADQAEIELSRAIDLAHKHDAKRAEMRARLQRASFMVGKAQPDEIITAVQEPLRYYAANHFPRNEAEANLVLAGALEELENYQEALRLSRGVLALGERIQDPALTSSAHESIARILSAQGNLPEALEHRERREQLNRAKKNGFGLSFDLTSRAELLIRLGRFEEAEIALREVDEGAAAGIDAFKLRLRRTAVLRAMRASIDRKWVLVAPFATQASAGYRAGDPPDENYLWGRILAEHALAQQGHSRSPLDVITGWMDKETDRSTRRDMAYWVAQTLLARGEHQRALSVAVAARDDPAASGNREQHWRMAVVAGLASQILTKRSVEGASIRAEVLREIDALKAAWPTQAAVYFARPDLALLCRQLQ